MCGGGGPGVAAPLRSRGRTFLAPRMTAEQVTSTRLLASSMRCARDSAEKPPKTTLWTAPILAQASMAAGSSTTMGM